MPVLLEHQCYLERQRRYGNSGRYGSLLQVIRYNLQLSQKGKWQPAQKGCFLQECCFEQKY